MKSAWRRLRTRMRDLSIKGKLSLIALATTLAALLAIGSVLAMSEYIRYRQDTVAVMQSHARITAINTSAALAFGDAASAEQTLAALRAAPSLRRASIYDRHGVLFATFGGAGPAAPQATLLEKPQVAMNSLVIDRPIVFSDNEIGFLRVEAGFEGYRHTLQRFALALLLAGVCALAVTGTLSRLLRGAVSGPVESLAKLVARVGGDHDFSVRAPVESRDELGTLAASFNTMLSEIEHRDANLARERDLVQAILNTMDAAVIVVDGDSRVLRANGAFLRATGRSVEDCIGKPVWEAAGIDEASQFRGSLEKGEEFEAVLRPLEGETRDYAWRTSHGAITDHRSGVTVVTGIDITERKRGEAALRQAKDAAEAANMAKSLFLANMSHEIRTPMNGVLGMAYTMQGSCVDDTQRHALQTIITSGEALLGLLNDILDFSKIEAGRLEIVRSAFPLHDHLEDVVQVFAAQARAKGLELRLEIDPSVPLAAKGDSLRLRQVLSNLVGNAIKFTPEGSVVVSVAKESPRTDGTDDFGLRVRVRDTGIGVSPDAQARIFEAFTQADATTQREHGGTGLGLAISRHLTTLMGGTLDLESEAGVGSTFSFTVPLGAAADSEFARARLEVKVLLADADPALRQYNANRLASWGVTVDVAASADEALLRVAATQDDNGYDALIVDTGLPGGWRRLLIELGASPRTASIPIALLGEGIGSASVGQLEGRTTVGLPKPVHSSALYNFLMARRGESLSPTARSGRARFDARVLLVEDNAVNISVARAMLEMAGCKVSVATDGLEALAAIEGERFDLVLMDCQLPGLDGYQVTRRIREREAREGGHQRIVAVTAHALSGDREACLAAGMDDYLAKPFSPSQMHAMLRANVGARPGSAAPKPPRREEPAATVAPVLDLEALGQLRGLEEDGGRALIGQVVGHFEKQLEELREGLKAARSGGDSRPAARAAHKLRSTAGHLGGARLVRLCQELELAGDAAQLSRLADAANRFDAEVAEFRQALERELAPAAPAQAVAAPAVAKALKALIVDDSEDDREILGRYLKRNGFTVSNASCGDEGLRIAADEQPDVVLIDRKLDQVDGVSLVPDFVRAGKAAPLRVIVVTALIRPGLVDEARNAGAIGVLEKSVRGGLPAAIRELLGQAGG